MLETQLVTSLWGDEHMYFRHQRMDDDIRHHPEWSEHVFAIITPIDVTGKPQLRAYREKQPSPCPFAFLFQ